MANECTLWTKDGKLIVNDKGELILSRSCPCTPQMCKAYYTIATGTQVEVSCAGGTKYNIPKTYTLFIVKSTENIPDGGSQVGVEFKCGTTSMSINVPEHYTWKCPSDCTCGFVIDKISVTRTSETGKTYVCPDNEEDTGTLVYDYKLSVVPEKANYGDPGAVPGCATRKYKITTNVANGCTAQSKPSVGNRIDLLLLYPDGWYSTDSFYVPYECSNGKPTYTYEFSSEEKHYLTLKYYNESLELIKTETIGPNEAWEANEVNTCRPPKNGSLYVSANAVVEGSTYVPTTTDKTFEVTLTSDATRSTTIPNSMKTLSAADVVKPTVEVTCTPTKDRVSAQQILINNAKAGDRDDVTIYVAKEP